MRPFNPFCGTVSNAQLLSLPETIRMTAPGVVTTQLSFLPPASSSATEVPASSDSRLATAQPPEPAPTTTKSNVSVTGDPRLVVSSLQLVDSVRRAGCGCGRCIGLIERWLEGWKPRIYGQRARPPPIESASATTTYTAASFPAARSCCHRAGRDRRGD